MKLDYVQWDITSACNLNCLHCREKVIESFKDDLSLEEGRNLIDQINDGDTHTLSIAGGEPMMSPHIREVLEYASGKFKRLVVSSNGTTINRRSATMLAKYVTTVQISIDGPDSKTHDYIRGEGVFNKAVQAIKLLQDTGVKVGIRMTLYGYNKDLVLAYVDFAKSLNLPDAYLRRVIPSGNASDLGVLFAKDLKKCLGDAIRYGRELGLHVASADYFCQIEFNDQARIKAEKTQQENGNVIGGCALGINSFYVMQNGVIAYCPYLPIFCGDLRKQSLQEIWETSEMMKIARSIRFNLKGKCADCRYKFACGGCRAYAYAVSGDILAEDTGCWID